MDFLKKHSEAISRAFSQCVEIFLTNYGCTPENAHEFSMEVSTGGWVAHILRNGKRIGHIETYSRTDETGIRFTTVATPIKKKK